MIFGHPTDQRLQWPPSAWTRPNQRSLTPLQKWLQQPPTEEPGVLEEEIEVVAIGAEDAEQAHLQHLRLASLSPSSRDQDILTFQQVPGTGARCIIGGGKELIFVLSPSLANGKTSLLQKLQRTNENSTNSAK